MAPHISDGVGWEAKVRAISNVAIVQFANVHEFVKYEWRPLPDDKLELARLNPHLHIRQVGSQEPKPAKSTVSEVLQSGSAEELVPEIAPKKKRAPSRRKAKK